MIFYVSGKSKPLPEVAIPFFDKFMHFAEFALFGFLASRAFRSSRNKKLTDNFLSLAIIVSVLYGLSDEIHQIFVPNRLFSIADLTADIIGGTLGAFIYGKYSAVKGSTL